jgi:hypothetical protein
MRCGSLSFRNADPFAHRREGIDNRTPQHRFPLAPNDRGGAPEACEDHPRPHNEVRDAGQIKNSSLQIMALEYGTRVGSR